MDALDRMLTRLALADDARLAPVLARVLPYAVTSLASAAPAVRKLVSTAPLPSPPALIRSEFQ
jgi:proteasome component ECM29